jgi:RNA polymerase sigma factor (sigma-70 family)
MTPSGDGPTSLTLLQRVRLHQRHRADPEASERFVAVYEPLIRRRCLRMGLQPADADDVSHDVLLRVLDRLDLFERRRTGSFRKYLANAVRWAVLDLRRARAEANELQPGSAIEEIAAPPEKDEEEISTVEVREGALELLREHYKGNERTLEAVRLRLVARMPAREVGERLGMSEGAVNTATCRVKRLMRERFGDLLPEDER